MFIKIIQSKSFLQASVILGVDVLERSTGKKITKVRDILIQKSSGHVVGLLVSINGRRKVLDLKQVCAIRRYNLEIDDRNSLVDYRIYEALHQKDLTTYSKTLNKPVHDKDKREVGKLKDIYFSSKDGRIARVEISQGFMKFLLRGQTIVRISKLGDFEKSKLLLEPHDQRDYIQELTVGMAHSST